MSTENDYDDPVRVAYDNAKDAHRQAEIALLKEIDEQIDYEDADGKMHEWQGRAHELGIPDVALALRHYRTVYGTFNRLLTGKEPQF